MNQLIKDLEFAIIELALTSDYEELEALTLDNAFKAGKINDVLITFLQSIDYEKLDAQVKSM